MTEILNRLLEQKSLSFHEAKALLTDIATNKFSPFQIAALAGIYNMRSPDLQEIRGFREALLEICIHVDLSDFNAIDIVGTGGDGKNTFNISTLACFIVAGAGEKVIKHGNYGVSSVTGSSNLLESLGYVFTHEKEHLQRQVEKAGICFLHDPLFHPSLKNVASVRRGIGTRTFFNMLGPLLNPGEPKHHFLGVNHLELARLYHYLYQSENKNYAIVHSLDGYDEISLTGPFKCYEPKGEHLYSPEGLGRVKISHAAIAGGKNNDENKRIFLDILSGKGSVAQNEVALTNAAFALSLINQKPFKESYLRAKESLESQRAKESLDKLLSI
ncbi:anthranilate phosphoribosyltransferase [Bacteroidetes bacterium endosymbiont of Geopemphigus sp.]|uniref:anthranilate phosphoribosyltransferase n=1 Tax=Bacteroidetes bacterium endosymbiont of Geopemphigus sp. TaxID=2047937 RepID=UPI000CD10E0E|nr:anthranilate phosphoribosyltransferase [Bacteroidetes bacterium endosymbiont of Geopemphigus sp.]